jgi:hypothetical protein
MTTQSTLGPFMTLILTLTARGDVTDKVIHSSRVGVVKSLLLLRLLTENLRQKPVGYANPSGRVFQLGGLQECRASSSRFKR